MPKSTVSASAPRLPVAKANGVPQGRPSASHITRQGRMDARLRARIETTVERLVEALDAFDALTADMEEDGSAEEEPDGEPSLGSAEQHPRGNPWGYSIRDRQGDQSHWARGRTDDREGDEHDGREPDQDTGIGDADGLQELTMGEQSLGSFDRMLNQEKSYRQRNSAQLYWEDAEQDDADREDNGDREQDAGEEPEHDEAERGIGDRDGLAEQLGGCL